MTHFPTSHKWVRVRRGRPCPVCATCDKACSFTDDGALAICSRVKSDRRARGCITAWLHILKHTERPAPIAKFVERSINLPASVLAPIEHRDGIYATLLRWHLPLSTEHRAKLYARGFSDREIEERGYTSTPQHGQAEEITAALSTYGLAGVPGFYRNGDRWQMRRVPRGMFVPYRDARVRIQALQYRPDEPGDFGKYRWFSTNPELTDDAGRQLYPFGTSSGAPVHHAYHHLLAETEEVTVTEGALKADLCAFFTQAPVIGIAGVSNFGADFATHLRAVAPRLHTVVVAYDMDLLVKVEVLRALESLTTQLQRAGFRVRVRTWPPQWKGLDDYLLAQLQRTEVCAA